MFFRPSFCPPLLHVERCKIENSYLTIEIDAEYAKCKLINHRNGICKTLFMQISGDDKSHFKCDIYINSCLIIIGSPDNVEYIKKKKMVHGE